MTWTSARQTACLQGTQLRLTNVRKRTIKSVRRYPNPVLKKSASGFFVVARAIGLLDQQKTSPASHGRVASMAAQWTCAAPSVSAKPS
jgi:hypothetical protein